MKKLPPAFAQFALAAFVLMLSPAGARGDIVYVWSGDGTVQKFATNGIGTVLTTNLPNWNGPVGLALDNVGNLYSGCPANSQIWRFSPSGAVVVAGMYVDSVSGLAFDKTGRLFATIPNYVDFLLLDYVLNWGYILDGHTTNHSQSHLGYPISLAFDAAGNMYVANGPPQRIFPQPSGYDNTIVKFSPDFTFLGALDQVAPFLNQPWGLAFDGAGNLFVSNSGTNQPLPSSVLKIAPNGSPDFFADGASGLNQPRGLAFDSAGNLYVANSGSGTVLKFKPNGNVSIFASGLNAPTSIAIFPGLKMYSATSIRLNAPNSPPAGAFQFNFVAAAGLEFSVLAATNLASAVTNWTTIGAAAEIAAGQYQFTDQQTSGVVQRFYSVRAP